MGKAGVPLKGGGTWGEQSQGGVQGCSTRTRCQLSSKYVQEDSMSSQQHLWLKTPGWRLSPQWNIRNDPTASSWEGGSHLPLCICFCKKVCRTARSDWFHFSWAMPGWKLEQQQGEGLVQTLRILLLCQDKALRASQKDQPCYGEVMEKFSSFHPSVRTEHKGNLIRC